MGRLTRTGDDAGMPIHDWPEQERPREKLIARGPATLSDAELLALFLGSGFGGRDAVQTARDLLQAHGPLRVLLDRPARELARLPGLGPARSCALAAGLELAQRYLAAELQQGEAVGNNPVAVGRYLQHRLRGQAREIFMALFLDNRHRLIACEELFQGTHYFYAMDSIDSGAVVSGKAVQAEFRGGQWQCSSCFSFSDSTIGRLTAVIFGRSPSPSVTFLNPSGSCLTFAWPPAYLGRKRTLGSRVALATLPTT